jgi:hypothetical protein
MSKVFQDWRFDRHFYAKYWWRPLGPPPLQLKFAQLTFRKPAEDENGGEMSYTSCVD